MPPKVKLTLLSSSHDMKKLLCDGFGAARLIVCASAAEFLGAGLAAKPDLAVIDMDIPEMSGRDLVLALRRDKKTADMLIAAFSMSNKPARAIASGLDMGADEYFILPKDAALVVPRLKNLLEARNARKSSDAPAAEEIFDIGGIKVSPASRTAVLKGRELGLTSLEFDMLVYFASNQGRVVSRGTLVQQLWKTDFGVNLRAVDKRIEVFRKKIKGSRVRVETVFGLGYICRF